MTQEERLLEDGVACFYNDVILKQREEEIITELDYYHLNAKFPDGLKPEEFDEMKRLEDELSKISAFRIRKQKEVTHE